MSDTLPVLSLHDYLLFGREDRFVVSPLDREHYQNIGHHAYRSGESADGYAINGRDFILLPTPEDALAVANRLLESIDREKVRGFHPWQFTGSAVIDDYTVVFATTTESGRYLRTELRLYAEPYAWNTQYAAQKHTCRCCKNVGQTAVYLAETVIELFGRLWEPMRDNSPMLNRYWTQRQIRFADVGPLSEAVLA